MSPRLYPRRGTHPTASKAADCLGYRQKGRGGDSGTKYVMAHLTPHRTPSSVFHSPLYRGRKKGAWGYSVATTVPPQHRKYFCPGTHPTASKTAGSLGYKVVYGYNSIQRGDSGTKYVRAHLTPQRSPSRVFHSPLLLHGREKRSLGVHAANVPPPHRKYLCPGTHPTAS